LGPGDVGLALLEANMAHDDNDALDQIDEQDLIWGGKAIGDEIGRSETQFYNLFRLGVFGDSVRKLGHRTFVGSRSRLRNIFFQT
jgi:hypothetical protein